MLVSYLCSKLSLRWLTRPWHDNKHSDLVNSTQYTWQDCSFISYFSLQSMPWLSYFYPYSLRLEKTRFDCRCWEKTRKLLHRQTFHTPLRKQESIWVANNVWPIVTAMKDSSSEQRQNKLPSDNCEMPNSKSDFNFPLLVFTVIQTGGDIVWINHFGTGNTKPLPLMATFW